ncbi:hypothetical protein A8L34_10575 [Bacillus sp. FJAT-27264]|uniref:SDR family NAD(P)-dependent oxidoreductase n=1 Tax=Paenibacillus sp. (strain DSM 101736 / FJAT-27264) TaxID=1850362 RepID=UPI000807DD7D|nr:SDR family NAD(P)-dependent oxidoreductase [Bacillus sp. FJAT-27264]OBZ14380.1 hypothetical protein A8L34_10575 [Bacillus sp. FJAT-27264]
MTLSKTVIITGGNAGLGYACAKHIALLEPNCQIVIAGRSQERIASAAHQLSRETGRDVFIPLQLDLGSLDSVQEFAGSLFTLNLPPLYGLICNAGVQYTKGIEVSSEGYEATFAINYLGHFALTLSLLDQMMPSARIIFLSSISHDDKATTPLPKPVLRSAEALASPNLPEGVTIAGFLGRAYTTSKLCIQMLSYELDRKLKAAGRSDITVNSFDPGGMLTGMTGEWSLSKQRVMKILWPILRLAPGTSTPEDSGRALAELMISNRYTGVSGKNFSMPGTYRRRAREKHTSATSYDVTKAQELWHGSEVLTSIQFALQSSSKPRA